MSGEVNRVPSGLLGYLDMKARGNNPRMLSGEVSPSIELDRWYYNQIRLVASFSQIIASKGFSSYFTVPAGVNWWVRGLSVWTIDLAAGTTVRVAPALLLRTDSANPGLMPMVEPVSFTTPQRVGVSWQGDIVLRPNDQVGTWYSDLVVGTSPSLVCVMDYAPIQI